MRLMLAFGLLAGCLARLGAGDPLQWIDGALSVPGDLAIRCGVGWADARLVAALESRSEEGRRPVSAELGFACPWIAAGSLSAQGLLREAARPLDASAASSIPGERTGLRLAPREEGPLGPAVLVAPVPGSLGLYLRPVIGGEAEVGGFLTVDGPGWLAADVLASLSRPPPDPIGDPWLLSGPPYAGGALARAAARVALRARPVSLTVSGGASWQELGLPGAFVRVAARLGSDTEGLDLLFAAASFEYRDPQGHVSADCAMSDVRLRLGDAQARLECRYHIEVERPDPLPRAFVPTKETTSFRISRSVGRALGAVISLEASKRLAHSVDGSTASVGSGSLRIRIARGELSAEGGAAVADGAGGTLTISGDLRDLLAGELGVEGIGRAPWVSGSVQARWRLSASSLSLRLSVEDVPLCERPVTRGHLSATIAWRTEAGAGSDALFGGTAE